MDQIHFNHQSTHNPWLTKVKMRHVCWRNDLLTQNKGTFDSSWVKLYQPCSSGLGQLNWTTIFSCRYKCSVTFKSGRRLGHPRTFRETLFLKAAFCIWLHSYFTQLWPVSPSLPMKHPHSTMLPPPCFITGAVPPFNEWELVFARSGTWSSAQRVLFLSHQTRATLAL